MPRKKRIKKSRKSKRKKEVMVESLGDERKEQIDSDDEETRVVLDIKEDERKK